MHPAIVANGSGQLATKAYNRGWFYVAWLLVVTVIAIGYPGLRAPLFGFEPFRIPANSMAPTILRNDYVMADTWHFEQSEPGINDLIVYEMPDNPDIHYMKRIVGLPGDTIEIQNDVLIRNGQSVSEGFVQLSGAPAGRISNFGPVEVPEDHYFVLGDNRHNSMDSRFTGPIHKDYLHGRIIYRWFAYDGGISWKRFPARLAVE